MDSNAERAFLYLQNIIITRNVPSILVNSSYIVVQSHAWLTVVSPANFSPKLNYNFFFLFCKTFAPTKSIHHHDHQTRVPRYNFLFKWISTTKRNRESINDFMQSCTTIYWSKAYINSKPHPRETQRGPQQQKIETTKSGISCPAAQALMVKAC